MGCNSSKRMEVAVDIYRPPPSSFAVFDVNGIQEPWLMVEHTPEEENEKTSHVPNHLLEKLNTLETTGAPHSWDEVSKVLEDLKPTVVATSPKKDAVPPRPPPAASIKKRGPPNSLAFHTLEEVEEKLSPKPNQPESKKTEPMIKAEKKEFKKPENRVATESKTELVVKPLKENIFILKDRLEREQEGKAARYEKLMSLKRDPLAEFPEKCPPGGGNSVVLYTTSLRGVRRTFDDCCRVKTILEVHRVVFDERDVSLHGGFLGELKELLGEEEATVPRLFVKGRYLGAAEQVVEVNESGRLGRILSYARVDRGVGRLACEGCGGARFVPCLDCGGSCKVVIADKKERCSKCNENGLAHCPACL